MTAAHIVCIQRKEGVQVWSVKRILERIKKQKRDKFEKDALQVDEIGSGTLFEVNEIGTGRLFQVDEIGTGTLFEEREV